MKSFPNVHLSETKQDLIKQVTEIGNFLHEFYKETPDELFVSRAIPDGWTIKRNLKHVISTNISFGWWVGAPLFFLKLFGKVNHKQLSIDKIYPSNRKLKDYGKYDLNDRSSQTNKIHLLEKLLLSNQSLITKIEKRSEEELDNLKAPFGKMSLRTFCHFILLHNLHHSNVVNLRLKD